jgi:hypothetical protein
MTAAMSGRRLALKGGGLLSAYPAAAFRTGGRTGDRIKGKQPELPPRPSARSSRHWGECWGLDPGRRSCCARGPRPPDPGAAGVVMGGRRWAGRVGRSGDRGSGGRRRPPPGRLRHGVVRGEAEPMRSGVYHRSWPIHAKSIYGTHRVEGGALCGRMFFWMMP